MEGKDVKGLIHCMRELAAEVNANLLLRPRGLVTSSWGCRGRGLGQGRYWARGAPVLSPGGARRSQRERVS